VHLSLHDKLLVTVATMSCRAGAQYSLDEACDALQRPKFADFTIRCDGHDFPVHRSIIYDKSEYFQRVLESEFKEKAEGVLELKETTVRAVAFTLLCCYSRDASGLFSSPTAMLARAFPQRLPWNVDDPYGYEELMNDQNVLLEVYVLADRLMIVPMKVPAAAAIMQVLVRFGGTEGLPWFEENSSDTPLMRFVDRIYTEAPAGDGGLRAATTAWLIEWCEDHPADKCHERVRELAVERDPDAALAAELMLNRKRPQKRRLLREQCLKKTLS
jgi:hypothetical protein